MHEGAVSAALGIGGIPSVSESTMVARDAELAGYEDGRVHFQHLSCAASVHAVAAAKERGFRVSAEVTPHHLLLTDEHVRGMDTRMKMNPPLASEADRLALIEGLRSRHDRLRRHRPRPARAPRKGGPLRAGADGHDRPGDGVRRAAHRAGAARHDRARAACRADDRRGRSSSACRPHASRSASPRTSRSWTFPPSGWRASMVGRAARRTAALPGGA